MPYGTQRPLAAALRLTLHAAAQYNLRRSPSRSPAFPFFPPVPPPLPPLPTPRPCATWPCPRRTSWRRCACPAASLPRCWARCWQTWSARAQPPGCSAGWCGWWRRWEDWRQRGSPYWRRWERMGLRGRETGLWGRRGMEGTGTSTDLWARSEPTAATSAPNVLNVRPGFTVVCRKPSAEASPLSCV